MPDVVLFEGYHEKLLLEVLIKEYGAFSEDFLYFDADQQFSNEYTVIKESQDDYCRSVVSNPQYSHLFKCENGKDHLDDVISDRLDFFLERFDNIIFLRDVDSTSHQTFRSDFQEIVEDVMEGFKSTNIQNTDITRSEINERGCFAVTSLKYSSNHAKMIGLFKDLEYLTDINYGESDGIKKEKISKFVRDEKDFFQEMFL